jgi:hypothetical protein
MKRPERLRCSAEPDLIDALHGIRRAQGWFHLSDVVYAAVREYAWRHGAPDTRLSSAPAVAQYGPAAFPPSHGRSFLNN